MADHQAVEVTKEQIESAQTMWDNFVVGSKYTIYATIIVLVGLALAFVEFS